MVKRTWVDIPTVDRAYLQGVLDNFVWAVINRVSHSGDMEHALGPSMAREGLRSTFLRRWQRPWRCSEQRQLKVPHQ